jgi:hypothetical protein
MMRLRAAGIGVLLLSAIGGALVVLVWLPMLAWWVITKGFTDDE